LQKKPFSKRGKMGKADSRFQVRTEWAKHLRPFLKRDFYKRLRKKAKMLLKEQKESE
jgi:deoxyribodipyrimidine photolyase-like uncharacterized protein